MTLAGCTNRKWNLYSVLSVEYTLRNRPNLDDRLRVVCAFVKSLSRLFFQPLQTFEFYISSCYRMNFCGSSNCKSQRILEISSFRLNT